MKTVVLGLGNTILSDDGAGVYAARMLRGILDDGVDVIEAELAGLDLMEMLKGYDRAVIIDAIKLDGEEPGTIFRLHPDDMKITPRLASCHDVDIVTALELGKRLGFHMPDDVVIFAVQVCDMHTIGEECTEAVAGVLSGLTAEIVDMLGGKPVNRVSIELTERRSRGA